MYSAHTKHYYVTVLPRHDARVLWLNNLYNAAEGPSLNDLYIVIVAAGDGKLKYFRGKGHH